MPVEGVEIDSARLLGLDLGERRIGVAVAEAATGRIRPLATLRRGGIDRDASSVAHLVAEVGATEIIVGLPLLGDGGEGPQAAITREWVRAVSERLNVPVAVRDERFTSLAAAEGGPRPRRGNAGGPPSSRVRTAYRARIDREAAALILQAELDSREGVRR